MTNFEHQISLGIVTLWQEYRHPLLLECFPAFLGYVRMIGRASNSISDPLMVNIVSFLPNMVPNFKKEK